MERQISWKFNIDTGCVEVKYTDGSRISVDCTRVECEVARNIRCADGYVVVGMAPSG